MKAEPDELMTRWTLIRKLTKADCDERSWNEFYAIYQRVIYGLARKAHLDHHAAEDVVSETMRSVCDRIRDFVPEPSRGSFKSWLLQMARWRILDQIRRKKARPIVECAPAAEETQRTATIERVADPESLNLDSVWEEAWQKELFGAALLRVKEEISPDMYQIFDFSVVRQMPAAKVARSLGVSAAKVYLAKHRVTRLIKAEVNRLEKRMG